MPLRRESEHDFGRIDRHVGRIGANEDSCAIHLAKAESIARLRRLGGQRLRSTGPTIGEAQHKR